MVIGDEFYVRFNNGEGMRRVYNADDINNEDEWCAQCGTPIALGSGEYYCCDVSDCGAVLCEYCGGGMTCNYYCPRHRGAFMDTKDPSYVYPYAFGNRNQFAFGVEIESDMSEEFVENVTNSDVIAGWDKDAHHPLLAVASPVPGHRRKCNWRHVLGVPPFFHALGVSRHNQE